MTGKSLKAGRSLLAGNSLLAEKFKKSKLSSATSPSHTETNGTSFLSSESPRLVSPKQKHAREEQVGNPIFLVTSIFRL